MVPVEFWVLDELPRASAITLDEGGDAKQSAWRGRGGGGDKEGKKKKCGISYQVWSMVHRGRREVRHCVPVCRQRGMRLNQKCVYNAGVQSVCASVIHR